MQINKPLVSVIVSTYNSEKFIKGKIDDLLEQTIIDQLEIIIVNSGSLQDEDSIIKKYLPIHNNIRYILTKERETIYKAWNRGIRIAQGEFITNSNTDDRLKNDALEKLSGILINNPDYGLVYANQYISTKPNQTFLESINCEICHFPDFNFMYQLERCIIGSQPMWRSSLHFVDDIWFDEAYEVCGDYDFHMKISQRYKIFHFPEVLGTFYKSKTRSNKEYENMLRTQKEAESISQFYVEEYLKTLSLIEVNNLISEVKKELNISFFINLIIKRLNKLRKSTLEIYPQKYFHSLEFLYWIYILLNDKIGRKEHAKKYANRYLRFRNSNKIKKYLKDLQ